MPLYELEHLSGGVIDNRNADVVIHWQNLAENCSASIERKPSQQLSFVHKDIEREVVDLCLSGPEVLQQVEVGLAGNIHSDDFAIEHGSVRQVLKRFRDVPELGVEDVASPGVESRLTGALHGFQSVAIKLDLVRPLRAFRKLCDGQALH